VSEEGYSLPSQTRRAGLNSLIESRARWASLQLLLFADVRPGWTVSESAASFCSRCRQPLAIASNSDVCDSCGLLSKYIREKAANPDEAHVNTATFHESQKGKIGDGDRTGSLRPGRETLDFEVGDSTYLPEAPPGYELIRQLGTGGMGAVYLAFEKSSERKVAIKFMHSPSSSVMFDRFLIEARALAILDHPNIIKVLTVETKWREPFFTMEYAEGGTLADLAKPNGLVVPEVAARLMLSVAEAIEAAHRAGVLHRDIKPRNILLAIDHAESTARERGDRFIPKVSDFGLAKRADREKELTRTGPLGTPAYMSPEAAAGRFRDISAQSDVYGLGATLYHLLTGRAPYAGDATDEILRQVIGGTPKRPRSIRAEIPLELEAVLLKAMEQAPSSRYPTAAAFADDLRKFLAGELPSARQWSRRRRAHRWLARNRAYWLGTAGILTLATMLVLIGRHWAPPASPTTEPAGIAVQSGAEVVDPLAEARKDLLDGKPVALIGEIGTPSWHRWQLGSSVFGKSPSSDETCYYETMGFGLLELIDNPGIDRYRVRLQIRQVQRSNFPAGTLPNDGEANCGLYFGHSFVSGADKFAADCFFAVTFRDFDPEAIRTGTIKPQWVAFEKCLIGHRPPNNAERLPRKLAMLDFEPAPVRPGHWRTIEVEVTPDSVRVFWQAREDSPRQEIKRPNGSPFIPDELYASMQRSLDAPPYGNKELLVPGWSPKKPLGIYTFGCAITIRNFTITPMISD